MSRVTGNFPLVAAVVFLAASLTARGQVSEEDYHVMDSLGPPGGERVEGYTDFLHILLVAGLGATGLDLLVAARLINFAAFALMLGGRQSESNAVVNGRTQYDEAEKTPIPPGIEEVT